MAASLSSPTSVAPLSASPDVLSPAPTALPEASLETMRRLVSEAGLRHIGIIMDGNRRWARERRLLPTAGHVEGVRRFKELVRYASDIGLRWLTAYTFSTENWKRSGEEVGFLMGLIADVLRRELAELHSRQVRIHLLGTLEGLPDSVAGVLQKSMATTANNQGLQLQLAINYGGRQEVVHAVRRLAEQVKQGAVAPEGITEDCISQALYNPACSDPELIIRPGGEARLSNFLLWQSAYSELMLTPTLWPDFTTAHFNELLLGYSQRQRRFGQ